MTTPGHVPLALQVAAAVLVVPVQLCRRHPVLVDHGAQAPFPSQIPALLQLPVAGSLFVLAQRVLGSAPPLSTLEQVPA